jgi:low temperature requirement protein LtrA
LALLQHLIYSSEHQDIAYYIKRLSTNILYIVHYRLKHNNISTVTKRTISVHILGDMFRP